MAEMEHLSARTVCCFRALKPWGVNLLPKKFIVYTDHQSLKHFRNQKHADHMLARWAAYLERFNYLIVHKSGATKRETML